MFDRDDTPTATYDRRTRHRGMSPETILWAFRAADARDPEQRWLSRSAREAIARRRAQQKEAIAAALRGQAPPR